MFSFSGRSEGGRNSRVTPAAANYRSRTAKVRWAPAHDAQGVLRHGGACVAPEVVEVVGTRLVVVQRLFLWLLRRRFLRKRDVFGDPGEE